MAKTLKKDMFGLHINFQYDIHKNALKNEYNSDYYLD